MKGIALVFATLIGGIGTMVVTTTEPAHAVVYCQYIDYPVGCVARPGVVLRPRAAVRAVTPGVGAPGVGVRRGTVGNRGGPVNRAGRR